MAGGDAQGVAAVKFQGPNVIGFVYKDTGYGAENKAFGGTFVFGALLGEEVLDGGDAEGHIRTQAQPTPNGVTKYLRIPFQYSQPFIYQVFKILGA